MEYKIAEGKNTKDLEKEVNRLMGEGYKPIGGITVNLLPVLIPNNPDAAGGAPLASHSGDGKGGMMLQVGQVWRKLGPSDWLKILRIELPDYPEYDNAAPGVSVQFRSFAGRWKKQHWFILARDEKHFIQQMEESNRFCIQGAEQRRRRL